MKDSIKDKFENIIHIGDFVFVSCCASKIARRKVEGITPKGVYISNGGWANINAVAKDHTQEMDYLQKRNIQLAQIEALGLCEGEKANDGWEHGY